MRSHAGRSLSVAAAITAALLCATPAARAQYVSRAPVDMWRPMPQAVAGQLGARSLPPREEAPPASRDAKDFERLTQQVRASLGNPPGINTLTGNVRVNDPAGDLAGDLQFRNSVAARGRFVVVVFEDTHGWDGPPQAPVSTVTSFAWSCDWGATFTDGGNVPRTAANQGTSFPRVAVAPDGSFYMVAEWYDGLDASGNSATQAVAMWKGTIDSTTCTLTWGAPQVIPGLSSSTMGYQTPTLAIDPASNRLWVSCIQADYASNAFDLVALTYDRVTQVWGPVRQVSSRTVSPISYFAYQPDMAVGINGEGILTWGDTGWFYWCDLSNVPAQTKIMVSTSSDGGNSWGPRRIVAPSYSTYFSNGPTDIYGTFKNYPRIAVDRSAAGAHRGRIYVTWPASAYWNAPNGSSGTVAEAEPNSTPATASPILLNQDGTGSSSTSADVDYWKIPLTKGDVLLARIEPQGYTCGGVFNFGFRMRLLTPTSTPAVAVVDTLLQGTYAGTGLSQVVFTCQRTGTYLLRIANNNNSASPVTYTLKTRGITFLHNTDSGRDEGDPMLSYSDDGITFSTPLNLRYQVTEGGASGYQETSPDLAVTSSGALDVVFNSLDDFYEGSTPERYGQLVDQRLIESTTGGNNWSSVGLNSVGLNTESSLFGNNNRFVYQIDGFTPSLVADDEHVMVAWDAQPLSTRLATGPDVYAQFVDREGPAVAFVSGPAEGAHLNVAPTYAITARDRRGGYQGNSYQFQLQRPSGGYILNTGSGTDSTQAISPGLLTEQGQYTFTAFARDEGGIQSEILTRHFTYDAGFPNITLIIDPAPTGTTSTPTVTFGWSGSDLFTPPGQLQYSYSMDGVVTPYPAAGVPGPLTAVFRDLGGGTHVFTVRARDEAGNESPPLTKTFYYSIPAPTTDNGYLNLQHSSFSWSAVPEAANAYRVRFYAFPDTIASHSLYSAHLPAGVTVLDYPLPLVEGQRIVARVEPSLDGGDTFLPGSQLSMPHLTDSSPPIAVITTVPFQFSDPHPSFAWIGIDGAGSGATEYSYRLAGQPWGPWSAGTTTQLSLPPDVVDYWFEVRVRDAAGNEGEACMAAPAGAVTLWRFNSDYEDEIGGLTAEPFGLFNGHFVPANSGQGLQLPGGPDDYVTVPDDPQFDPGTGSFAIEAWIKTTDQGEAQPIFSKREDGGDVDPTPGGYSSTIQLDVNVNGVIEFRVNGDQSSVLQTLPGVHVVTDDVFHHVVAMRNTQEGKLKLYVDGVLDAAAVLDASGAGAIRDQDSSPDSVRIGASNSQGTPEIGRTFNGTLDEVAFYRAALTAEDVFNVYDNGRRDPLCTSLALRHFTVDGVAPTIDWANGPDEGQLWTSSTVTLGIAVSDNGPIDQVQYSFRLNGGAYSAYSYSNQVTYSSLPDGPQVVDARARDAAGNLSNVITRHFTVHAQRPITRFLTGPAPGADVNSPVTITWTIDTLSTQASRADVTYQWFFDGNAPTPSSPDTVATASLGEGYHTFALYSSDGVVGQGAFLDFRVDLTPPNVSIPVAPPQYTRVTPVVFTLSGVDNFTAPAQLRYSVRMDGGALSVPSTQTSYSFPGLSDGPHTFEAIVYDNANNVDLTPATYTFFFDSTPPETFFLTGPADSATIDTNRVTFTYGGTDNVSTPAGLLYKNGLDGAQNGLFSSATSRQLGPLADGPHTFFVLARDQALNEDPTPVMRTFFVAAQPAPVPVIVSGPANGGRVSTLSPTFVWTLGAHPTTTPPDSIVYRWKLDAGAFTAYSRDSIAALGPLAEASHTFTVEALDRVTSKSSSVVRTFTCDITPPNTTITAGPADSAWVATSSVTFSFSSTEAPNSFYWRVDGNAWSGPGSATSVNYVGLLDGAHVFEVKAVDQAGNEDPTPATRGFKKDTVFPTLTFLQPASGAIINTDTLTVTWIGSDNLVPPAGLYYQYRIDGGAASNATIGVTSHKFGPLTAGPHSIEVRAIDLANNAPQFSSLPITIDLQVAPVATIISGLANNARSNNASQTFVWTLGAHTASTPRDSIYYAWKLDGGAFTALSRDTVANLIGLAEGSHTLTIAARDTVVHLGSQTTRTFIIDQTPPNTVMTGGPADSAWSAAVQPTFSFTGTDTPLPVSLLFSWRVDGGAWSVPGAGTSANMPPLPDGTHVFEVKAIDGAGNEDPTPATVGYKKDTTRPTAVIVQPTAGATINSDTVTVVSLGADNLTPTPLLAYQYGLDGAGFSAAVTNQTAKQFGPLAPGTHVVRVQVADLAGNLLGTTVQVVFTITTNVAPVATVISGPANGAHTSSTGPSFVWTLGAHDPTTSPDSVYYAWTLDGGAFTALSRDTVANLTALSEGAHTFTIATRDTMTHLGTQTVRTFTVDPIAANTLYDQEWAVPSIPLGVGVDPEGNVWVTCLDNFVRKYSAGGQLLLTFGGSGFGQGQFLQPFELDFAPNGDVFIADYLNHRVQRFSSTGAFQARWPVPGLRVPGIARDEAGNIYATDFQAAAQGGGHVYKFTDTGVPITSWLTGEVPNSVVVHGSTVFVTTFQSGAVERYSLDGTPQGSFLAPLGIQSQGLSVTSQGRFYLAAHPNDRISVFSDGGGSANTIGSSGAGPGEFVQPHDTAIDDAARRLYVADRGNARIQKLMLEPAVAPSATILSGPANGAHTSSTDLSFVWTLGAHDPTTPPDSVYYAWALDGGAFTALSRDTVANLANVIEGAHTFTIAARDTMTHLGTQTVRTFTVDTTTPNTTIASGPINGGWSNTANVGFSWNGSDNLTSAGQLKFSFRSDGGAFSTAASGTSTTLNGLAAGAHSFEVRAEDLAGNQDPTPDSRSFTVDLVAPETQLLTGPAEGEILTANGASFTWNGNDDFTGLPQLRYATRLDAAGFSALTSATSIALSGLTDGPHTFYVRATDLANNNDGSPEVRSFIVDAQAPVITIQTGPAANACLTTTGTSFTWSAIDVVTDAGAIEFAYALDGAPATPFATGLTSASLSGMLEGAHSFVIQARDERGHVASITRAFKVDLTAPLVNVPTTRLLDANRVRITCTGSDAISLTGFRVQVSTSPTFDVIALDTNIGAAGVLDYTGTQGSTYYARAAATDCAGNQSAFSGTSNGTTIANLPDLAVTQVLVPSSAISGQVIPVTFTVANSALGATNAPQWYDDVYLSPTPAFDGGTATFLTRVLNLTSLAPGESYTVNANVTMPLGTSGTQYLIVLADNAGQVPETDGGNNTRASAGLPVSIGDVADLTVQQVVAPPTALTGETVTIQWTVRNDGTGRTNVDNWYDTVMFSDDNDFDFAVQGGNNLRVLDLPVGTFQHVGALDPGQSYTRSATVTVPNGVSGAKYFLVVSDLQATVLNQVVPERGSVFEYLSEVNAASAEPTEVAQQLPSDLVAVSVTGPANASSGTPISLTWKVRNGGFNPTPNQSWTDRLWLSSDATLDAGDLLLSSVARSGVLGLDATYTGSANVTIPNGVSGSYYLFVSCDALSQLSEHLETNNSVRAAAPTAIALSPWPNLVPFSGDVPDTVVAGGMATVNWLVQNTGTKQAAGSWYDDVLFSTSPTIGGAAPRVMVSQHVTPSAMPGTTYGSAASFAIPTNFSGTYYVYLHTDTYNQLFEHTDEGDNTQPIGTVFVNSYPTVDLAVSALTAPAAATAGGPLAVSFSVTNQGQGTTLASGWAEDVWLSIDQTLQTGSDILLTSPGHGGSLPAGAGYTRSYTATIPNGTGGDYYVMVRTDPNASSGDGNPANNVAVSAAPVAITAVAPADLVVTAVTAASSDIAGQPIHIDYTVRNSGPGTIAGRTWFASSYLSLDPLLDGSDVLLGSVNGPATLGPATSSPEGMDVVLPGWASGAYYLIVSADSRNDIWEAGSEGNNAQLTPVTVILPPPADLVVSSVIVPGSGVPGESVSVTFTIQNQGLNPASGTMQNAVYASSDAAFQSESDPLVAVQNMVVDLAPGASQVIVQEFDINRPIEVDQDGNIIGTLPPLSPGNYHAIVRANVRANIRELDLTNNDAASGATLAADMASLTLETPTATTLTTDQARFYRVTVPAGQDLTFSLGSNLSSATNEMFVAFGHTPTPGDYDFSGPPGFTASPKALVPGTQAGTYYVMVLARNLGVGQTIENVSLLARLLPFQLTAVTPSVGGRDGRVTCTLTGAGLRDATVIRLEQSGIPRATATLSRYVNSTELLTRFDLTGVPEGLYDVVAVNGAESVSLPNAFTVETPRPMAVVVGGTHPDVLRKTATGLFQLRFTNPSNQDVPVLKARVLFPATSILRSLETSTGLLSTSERFPGLITPLTGDVSVLHKADGTDSLAAVDLIGGNLAPGETRTVTLGLSGFETSPYSVRALASALPLNEFLDREISANEAARQKTLATSGAAPAALVSLAGDPVAYRDAVLMQGVGMPGIASVAEVLDYSVGRPAGMVPPAALLGPAAPQTLLDDLASGDGCVVASAIPDCTPEVANVTTALPACVSVFDAGDVPVVVPSGGGYVAHVAGGSTRGFDVTVTADAKVVTPCDPNIITGPAGFGDQRWVSANEAMSYRIDFENLAGVATAPAQVVKVTLPLDADLDITSFRLSDFGFGPNLLTVPTDRTSYSIEPFFASLGLRVRITAGLDLAKREAFWTFTSIDPATGQQPTNPYVGFLPVNSVTGNGTGFVTFSIRAQGTAPSGASVLEQGSIKFDANAPLLTAQASNKLDTRLPVSAVLPTVTLLDSTRARLAWTSADDSTGAGLQKVALWQKRDSGPFTLYQDGLTVNQLDVPVDKGHTFAFYTLATDNTGNTEPTKTVADASVTVGTPALPVEITEAPLANALLQNYPNPFSAGTTLRFDLARPAQATIEIFDVQGRLVARPLDHKLLPAGHHTLEAGTLPRGAGVYFYRLKIGDFEQTRRMVRLR